MRVSRLTRLIPLAILLAVVLVPLAAGAQTPAPGEEAEVVKPWTWYLSIPVGLGAFGLALLVVFSYLRLSSRFYGREEPPAPKPQPQYAGVNAPAYPAPVTQAAQPAPAPAQPAQQPAAEPAPQQAAAGTTTQEKPAEEKPAEEKPAEEKPAEEKPAEAPAKEAPAEEEPEPAAEAGPDDDVYERVLKEQLDKGVSPKVAEGRAKSAAIKAGRAPKPAAEPKPEEKPEQKAEPEAAATTTEAPAEEAPAEEAPAEEAPAEEAPAEEAPAEEAPAEEAPAEEEPASEEETAEPAAEAAGGDDVYEQVLKEQLDKGVAPKVAEGRAKAAALKAKRQAGG